MRAFAIQGRGSPRSILATLALICVICALGLFTYRRTVDGPFDSYLAATGLSMASAVVAFAWVRRVFRGPVLAGAVALLACLPAPAIHAVRLMNRDAPVVAALPSMRAYRMLLEPTLRGDAALVASPNELVLSAPAGSTGFLTLGSRTLAAGRSDLPRALVAGGVAPVVEELTFTASVERDGVYFALLEVGRLVVQITSWGLLAMLPRQDGQLQSNDVSLESVSGAWHTWVVRAKDGRLSLSRDGREVFSTAHAGELRPISIGATRTDREHGGRMRLRSFEYRRTLR